MLSSSVYTRNLCRHTHTEGHFKKFIIIIVGVNFMLSFCSRAHFTRKVLPTAFKFIFITSSIPEINFYHHNYLSFLLYFFGFPSLKYLKVGSVFFYFASNFILVQVTSDYWHDRQRVYTLRNVYIPKSHLILCGDVKFWCFCKKNRRLH